MNGHVVLQDCLDNLLPDRAGALVAKWGPGEVDYGPLSFPSPRVNPNMKIFISHYHVEKALAIAVKQELLQIFGGLVDVFIADDIHFGSNWLNEVSQKLSETDTVLVLFSPDSVVRPWINIEAGYGVMTGKYVIPLCHSGLDKKNLPVIYALQQSIELCERDDITKLFSQIAERTAAKRFLGDMGGSVERWITRMHQTLLSAPRGIRTLDAKPCVWVIGSNRDLPEKQADKNNRFVTYFAQVLIQRGFRVVFGRSGLLDKLADSLGHELEAYDYKILSEFGTTSAMYKNSPGIAPNPVIVLGSMRADKGPRRVFHDTLGYCPDVMVVIGGSPNGRTSEEIKLAESAQISVLPLCFTGGQAALSKATVDPSLADEANEIQQAKRDIPIVAQRLCDLIEKEAALGRAKAKNGGL